MCISDVPPAGVEVWGENPLRPIALSIMYITLVSTVLVNKKFTFRFKKTIVLQLTVLSKNGTTTERKRNGHAIRKRNGTYKKNERNVLRTVYTRSVKKLQRSSFRDSIAVFE